MSDVNRTQQMRGMAEFIRSTGVPSTLERLSYGQGLFTGAGGLGGTTRLRPEVAEAALTVAPMVGPAAKLAGRAVMATRGLPVGMGIKSVGKIDELTGLPLNPDGTVTLFHHTNKNAAEQIAKTGRLKSAGEPSVYLTTQKTPDTGYGDVVVPVRVRPSMLNLDDEFPGGRMDFSIDVGRPKGSIPVVVEKPSFEYPQEEALRLAQQRAALPVSEGGLGLPPNNTPMDRARAMGFESGWAHGSPRSDITELRSSRIGAQGPGAYATNYLPEASTYSQTGEGATVYPLMVRRSEALNTKFNNPYDELGVNADDALLSELFGRGKSAIVTTQEKTPDWLLRAGAPDMPERQHFVSVRPENFRSRFAAFDPTRRNEPDLLAGALPFTALLDEENRQAIGEFLTNPIMYRDPFGSTVR